MGFKKQLINALGEKWVADLPDLTLLINKIDKLCDDFDPTQFFDNKLYIEKLMKMSKELKKKKINRQKGYKNFFLQQNYYVGAFFLFLFIFVSFCLIFLTEATNLCIYFSNIYFMYFMCFFEVCFQ